MPVYANDEKAVFLAALERGSVSEREAYLQQACADDPELLQRLRVLMSVHEQGQGPLDGPPPGIGSSPTIDSLPNETAGTVIGPYKLLEQIGEGGFGVVFMAEQTEPVRRKVALKILKPGMDTRQVVARFEAERQALAIMDHPNIAKVHDGGTTPSGRPYFVMELVKGVPITEFCDQNHLTPRQRLELFIPVCQAVQHAHQKGIIHRDLKPSNVLVSRHDTAQVVKVIDFGVAKALGQELTDKTLFTAIAQMVGTPLYMSPEQAGMSDLDIDTRSDIYSLGVLLYELLTGTTPFEKERFKQAAYDEIRRIIREEEPPRPSTRLSDSKDSLPSISAQRHTEPAKLTRLVRGELDWIVMKALEKDRNRRYETANGFAMDVQRYLAGEAVLAHPPSASYRLKKVVRRYKGQVIAASLVLLALIAGLAASLWQMDLANRERDAKANALIAEQKARQDEERERKYAQAIADFVKDDFFALTSVEGQDRFGGTDKNQLTKDTTLRQLLDRAAAKLDQRHDLEPRIEAELRWMIGVNYRGIGAYPQAVAFLEKCAALLIEALPAHHPGTLQAQNSLAVAYRAAGRRLEAIRLFEQVRDACVATDHPHTLVTLNNLAQTYQDVGRLPEAIRLFEQVRDAQVAKLGADHTYTLITLHSLGTAYRDAGRLPEAIQLFEQVRDARVAKLGADHPNILRTLNDLAAAYRDAGRLPEAIRLFEQVRDAQVAKLGADHPETLRTLNNLGVAYRDAGKLPEATRLFEQVRDAQVAKLGADHPDTFRTLDNLAQAYHAAAKLPEAIRLFERVRDAQVAKLGADHPNALATLNNLACAYHAAAKLPEAIRLFEQVRDAQVAKLGADHPSTLATLNNLACAYQAVGKLPEAIRVLEQVRDARVAKLGADHPSTLLTLFNLAGAYQAVGKLPEAIQLFEQVRDAQVAKLGADHPSNLLTLNTLAEAYQAAGKRLEAIPLFEQVRDAQVAKLGADHPSILLTLNALAEAYQAAGKRLEAIPLFEQAAQGIARRKFLHEHAGRIIGATVQAYAADRQFDKAEAWARRWLAQTEPQSPAYAAALVSLGSALLGQEKWAEAEKTLTECLALREKQQPDAWYTFSTMSRLGGALVGQKKYAEAEPLLLKGYEGVKARADQIPPPYKQVNLSQALDRLVQLYEALGKPDEAARWRKELERQKK
jgi:serine/threonine protein kinase